MVIATTGGSKTRKLREKYPEHNILIEDFIPFNDIMPECDVYITNGGYGGVMLGISNNLPMVVAGIHEGKNEINGRVEYFGLGINLGTENPTASQIKTSVESILKDSSYKQNVNKLANEFAQYSPMLLSEKYISELILREPSPHKTYSKLSEERS